MVLLTIFLGACRLWLGAYMVGIYAPVEMRRHLLSEPMHPAIAGIEMSFAELLAGGCWQPCGF